MINKPTNDKTNSGVIHLSSSEHCPCANTIPANDNQLDPNRYKVHCNLPEPLDVMEGEAELLISFLNFLMPAYAPEHDNDNQDFEGDI
ncbi:MAG: hypothetical protein COB54_06795 [Alphaproteobacteria bacterium]|nr:MAG: hypothetical protein COB54_06795 [Alphaproteobacteria bacterium]